jgi:hypothetical protein
MKLNRNRWFFTFLSVLFFVQALVFASADPYVGWKKIETEHFELVFEPRDVESALLVASFADEVYTELTALLSYTPLTRIPVVLTGRSSYSNGYYSPFPSSVFLFVTSPDDRFLGSRSSNWLKSLFIHEVTHYIHLTSPVGPAKYLTKVFGPAVPAMNTPLMNGWWIEGITTYTESTFAEGGRGDSSLFALTYEAPLQEKSMWTLAQGNYQSYAPPSGRIYTTGYLMVDYLMRTYGPEIFARVNSSFAWFPFFGVSHALKQSTGFDASELFTFALEEKESSLSSFKNSLASYDRQGNFYLPYATERGLFGYAYTQDDGGVLVSYGKETLSVLTRLPIYDSLSLTLAHNGENAVFSMLWIDSTHPSSLSLAPLGYSDLYRYSLVFDTFERLTVEQQLYHPSLSDDGKRLVAIERQGTRYRLVEVDQPTGTISVLYENPEGSIYEPQLSPDKERVVAIEIVQGQSALIAIDRNMNKTVLVGFGAGELRNPRFLDNETLLYSSDETGRFCLYRLDCKTKSIERALYDSLGILGAVQTEKDLYYETYTADGFKVGSLARSSLFFEPVPLVTGVLEIEREEPEEFAMQGYYDIPRFNLWLPLPMEDNGSYIPGVWAHFSSLLRKHKLLAQAGFSFQDTLPVVDLYYTYTPGPFSLSVQLNGNQFYGSALTRQQLAETTLVLPLWKQTGLRAFSQIAANLDFSFIKRSETSLLGSSLQLAYQTSARTSAKDYFGSTCFSSYVGGLAQYALAYDSWVYRGFGGISSYVKVFDTHQRLGFAVDALWVNSGSLKGYLPFEGSIYGNKDAEAKALLSLRYQIPLGLFDQSLFYGGLTAMGLSLFAQSALYLGEGTLDWEEEVYVGAKLSARLVLGSSAVLSPSIGLTVGIHSSTVKWYVAIGGLFDTAVSPGLPW